LKQSTNPKLAKKILHIIVAAARSLTPTEMDVALATERTRKSTEDVMPNRLPSIERSIRDICSGLVKVVGSQANKNIELVHHTAKEFLVRRSYNAMPCQGFWTLIIWVIRFIYQAIYDVLARVLGLWKHSLEPVESNRILAEACISYLLFDEFSSHPLVMDSEAKGLYIRGEVDRYTKEHEFLDYAAKHWATHLRETKSEDGTALLMSGLEVCDTGSKRFLTWFQVYWTTVDSLWLCPQNFTNLIVWSYFGHEAIVGLLLKNGAKVDIAAKDDGGKTALHWAVENGHKNVAQLLSKNVANVDMKDRNEWTALHIAAAKGHEGLAELLLIKGAEIGAVTNHGQTALHLAAGNGHTELVALLLNYGTVVDMKTNLLQYTALHLAARNGHKEVVRILLDGGADVSKKTGVIGEYMAEYTALHLAAMHGHTEVVKLLLDRSSNPAVTDKMGATPLHKAAENGHRGVTSLLLDEGADVVAEDQRGESPLHKAAKNGHAAVASLLMDENANIAAKDTNGATALHYAAANRDDAVSQLLIEKWIADVAAEDNDGKTPLHYAARSAAEVVARLLIEQGGADVAAMDNDGKTALHDAAARGHQNVVQLLVDKGVNVHAEDKSGKTALHYAAANGRKAVVEQLLRGKKRRKVLVRGDVLNPEKKTLRLCRKRQKSWHYDW
jgi:ankyrin repeat protein